MNIITKNYIKFINYDKKTNKILCENIKLFQNSNGVIQNEDTLSTTYNIKTMFMFNCKEDIPSKIYYDENENIKTKEWLNEKGEYHRIQGPAIIHYNKINNKPIYKEYWINGVFLNKIEVNG